MTTAACECGFSFQPFVCFLRNEKESSVETEKKLYVFELRLSSLEGSACIFPRSHIVTKPAFFVLDFLINQTELLFFLFCFFFFFLMFSFKA